jgi:hypothetical protein
LREAEEYPRLRLIVVPSLWYRKGRDQPLDATMLESGRVARASLQIRLIIPLVTIIVIEIESWLLYWNSYTTQTLNRLVLQAVKFSGQK